MIDNAERPYSVDCSDLIPRQTSVQDVKEADFYYELHSAAEELTTGLVVYDNFSVYGLVGDANDLGVQEKIRLVKGERRGREQPLGWTAPYHHALDAIDIDKIEDARLRQLFGDADELTRRLGGLGFLRGPADLSVKYKRNIADSIIPDAYNSTVQIYSPTGNDVTSRFIRYAMAAGVEPVMTSANISGQPEIVTADEAKKFAQHGRYDLTVVTNQEDEQKPERPAGSYPVWGIQPDYVEVIRPGFLEPRIGELLLAGYPVAMATHPQANKYPDNVLRLQDLPEAVRNLQGPELRLGILSVLGWHEGPVLLD